MTTKNAAAATAIAGRSPAANGRGLGHRATRVEDEARGAERERVLADVERTRHSGLRDTTSWMTDATDWAATAGPSPGHQQQGEREGRADRQLLVLAAARDLERQQLAEQDAERERHGGLLLAAGAVCRRDPDQQRAAGQCDRPTEQSNGSDTAHAGLDLAGSGRPPPCVVQPPKNL